MPLGMVAACKLLLAGSPHVLAARLARGATSTSFGRSLQLVPFEGSWQQVLEAKGATGLRAELRVARGSPPRAAPRALRLARPRGREILR